MPDAFKRRLAALETRQNASAGAANMRLFLTPRGLDAAAEACWRAETVAPVIAAGDRVVIVRFVAPAPQLYLH